MRMIWDSAADAKLFAAVIATSKPTFDYNTLAVIMGSECTAKAISHRISKLREIAKNFDTTAAATQTPVKRIRKLKDKLATSNDDDDDDDNEKGPIKKRKIALPHKRGKSKQSLNISKSGPEAKEKDKGEESN